MNKNTGRAVALAAAAVLAVTSLTGCATFTVNGVTVDGNISSAVTSSNESVSGNTSGYTAADGSSGYSTQTGSSTADGSAYTGTQTADTGSSSAAGTDSSSSGTGSTSAGTGSTSAGSTGGSTSSGSTSTAGTSGSGSSTQKSGTSSGTSTSSSADLDSEVESIMADSSLSDEQKIAAYVEIMKQDSSYTESLESFSDMGTMEILAEGTTIVMKLTLTEEYTTMFKLTKALLSSMMDKEMDADSMSDMFDGCPELTAVVMRFCGSDGKVILEKTFERS